MLTSRRGSAAVRSLFVWFASPRLAALTAVRLAAVTPGIRVWLPTTSANGAEGPVTLLGAAVPLARCADVNRQLAALRVPLLWDPVGADPRPAIPPPILD